MNNKPTPGQIVIMASGAVALIFSFFNFYKAGDEGVHAWSSGLFPLATYIAIIGVILAAGVALSVFASVAMPDRILGFTRQQLHLALGFFALLIAIGYLLVNKFGASLGVGFWFMLIASIGMVVGAVLEGNEATSGTGPPPSAPPTV